MGNEVNNMVSMYLLVLSPLHSNHHQFKYAFPKFNSVSKQSDIDWHVTVVDMTMASVVDDITQISVYKLA